MSGKWMGKRFENDYEVEALEEFYEELISAVTVPVNVAVKAEHRVLDLSKVEEMIRGADRVSLQDCGCKVDYGNCDAPRNVCVSLDEAVDLSSRYNPREATVEEALEALSRSHEAGLVHMAYTLEGDDGPKIICSCCPCCCHTLSGLLRLGLAPHVLKSDLVAVDDKGVCTDCGLCVDRCVFGAREMVDGALKYDAEQCFGCGLCVSTCPAEAISLVDKI